MESPIVLSGHVVGILKEYMRDLVDQAVQEAQADSQFGFAAPPYRPDQALSDLLSLLDDRLESEGMQVGLPENFLHHMWSLCNEATAQVSDRVWLEGNFGSQVVTKARTRELTYHALMEFIEARARGRN